MLSVFLGTFAYSAAGLYTVGVAAGTRTERYPRLAVSGSIVLLFACIASVLYFADHLAHAIQIDAMTARAERAVVRVIQDPRGALGTTEQSPPPPPAWAVPVLSDRSGYPQTAHTDQLVAVAGRSGVWLRLRPRVGEHVVAGTPLAWIWRTGRDDPAPDPAPLRAALDRAVRSASSAPWNRTPRSASASSSTWRATSARCVG